MLSVVLAGIGLLLASLTPRRGIGMAVVIAVLVMVPLVQGLLSFLAMEQGRMSLAQYSRLLSPSAMVDGAVSWLFHLDPPSPAGPPGEEGPPVLPRPTTAQGLACLAGVITVPVACYGLLLARYRKVSVS